MFCCSGNEAEEAHNFHCKKTSEKAGRKRFVKNFKKCPLHDKTIQNSYIHSNDDGKGYVEDKYLRHSFTSPELLKHVKEGNQCKCPKKSALFSILNSSKSTHGFLFVSSHRTDSSKNNVTTNQSRNNIKHHIIKDHFNGLAGTSESLDILPTNPLGREISAVNSIGALNHNHKNNCNIQNGSNGDNLYPLIQFSSFNPICQNASREAKINESNFSFDMEPRSTVGIEKSFLPVNSKSSVPRMITISSSSSIYSTPRMNDSFAKSDGLRPNNIPSIALPSSISNQIFRQIQRADDDMSVKNLIDKVDQTGEMSIRRVDILKSFNQATQNPTRLLSENKTTNESVYSPTLSNIKNENFKPEPTRCSFTNPTSCLTSKQNPRINRDTHAKDNNPLPAEKKLSLSHILFKKKRSSSSSVKTPSIDITPVASNSESSGRIDSFKGIESCDSDFANSLKDTLSQSGSIKTNSNISPLLASQPDQNSLVSDKSSLKNFIQIIEIIKRPGQTLGLYIREGKGTRRLDGVFISRMAQGSSIERSGLLKVGDEILKVNGVDVTKMSLDDVVVIMSIPRRLLLELKTVDFPESESDTKSFNYNDSNETCQKLYDSAVSIKLTSKFSKSSHLPDGRCVSPNVGTASYLYDEHDNFKLSDQSVRQQMQQYYQPLPMSAPEPLRELNAASESRPYSNPPSDYGGGKKIGTIIQTKLTTAQTASVHFPPRQSSRQFEQFKRVATYESLKEPSSSNIIYDSKHPTSTMTSPSSNMKNEYSNDYLYYNSQPLPKQIKNVTTTTIEGSDYKKSKNKKEMGTYTSSLDLNYTRPHERDMGRSSPQRNDRFKENSDGFIVKNKQKDDSKPYMYLVSEKVPDARRGRYINYNIPYNTISSNHYLRVNRRKEQMGPSPVAKNDGYYYYYTDEEPANSSRNIDDGYRRQINIAGIEPRMKSMIIDDSAQNTYSLDRAKKYGRPRNVVKDDLDASPGNQSDSNTKYSFEDSDKKQSYAKTTNLEKINEEYNSSNRNYNTLPGFSYLGGSKIDSSYRANINDGNWLAKDQTQKLAQYGTVYRPLGHYAKNGTKNRNCMDSCTQTDLYSQQQYAKVDPGFINKTPFYHEAGYFSDGLAENRLMMMVKKRLPHQYNNNRYVDTKNQYYADEPTKNYGQHQTEGYYITSDNESRVPKIASMYPYKNYAILLKDGGIRDNDEENLIPGCLIESRDSLHHGHQLPPSHHIISHAPVIDDNGREKIVLRKVSCPHPSYLPLATEGPGETKGFLYYSPTKKRILRAATLDTNPHHYKDYINDNYNNYVEYYSERFNHPTTNTNVGNAYDQLSSKGTMSNYDIKDGMDDNRNEQDANSRLKHKFAVGEANSDILPLKKRVDSYFLYHNDVGKNGYESETGLTRDKNNLLFKSTVKQREPNIYGKGSNYLLYNESDKRNTAFKQSGSDMVEKYSDGKDHGYSKSYSIDYENEISMPDMYQESKKDLKSSLKSTEFITTTSNVRRVHYFDHGGNQLQDFSFSSLKHDPTRYSNVKRNSYAYTLQDEINTPSINFEDLDLTNYKYWDWKSCIFEPSAKGSATPQTSSLTGLLNIYICACENLGLPTQINHSHNSTSDKNSLHKKTSSTSFSDSETLLQDYENVRTDSFKMKAAKIDNNDEKKAEDISYDCDIDSCMYMILEVDKCIKARTCAKPLIVYKVNDDAVKTQKDKKPSFNGVINLSTDDTDQKIFGSRPIVWDESFEIDLLKGRKIDIFLYHWAQNLQLNKTNVKIKGREEKITENDTPLDVPKLSYRAVLNLSALYSNLWSVDKNSSNITKQQPYNNNNAVKRLKIYLQPRGALYIILEYSDPLSIFKRTLKTQNIFGVELPRLVENKKLRSNTGSDTNIIDLFCIILPEIERRGGLDSVAIYNLCSCLREKLLVKGIIEKNLISTNFSAKGIPDINILTDIVKDFLRELPEPLITNSLYQMLVDAFSVFNPTDPTGNESLLLSVVECLPKINKDNIDFLLRHLKKVLCQSRHNKMNLDEISAVFGPILLIPSSKISDPDPDTAFAIFKYLFQIWKF
ncbi:uncharacterized protein LOC135928125 isoform X1 [Gordionus sp. m RMFG-2023]|uniref:uncharacterized protein LOC135928125 isoform X1 n=1 Tax=Gordionus sp. m RMFG-2023 TaxID=3053472 RepID=UPI0031FD4347